MLEHELAELKMDIAAMQRVFNNAVQTLYARIADLESKLQPKAAAPEPEKIPKKKE